MPVNRAIVSVTFRNANVRSVFVEQWRRRKKNQGNRTPEPIPGSPTTPATRVDANSPEWVTEAFNLSNSGGNQFKRYLRVKAFSGAGGTGNLLAMIALPSRRVPKPRHER